MFEWIQAWVTGYRHSLRYIYCYRKNRSKVYGACLSLVAAFAVAEIIRGCKRETDANIVGISFDAKIDGFDCVRAFEGLPTIVQFYVIMVLAIFITSKNLQYVIAIAHMGITVCYCLVVQHLWDNLWNAHSLLGLFACAAVTIYHIGILFIGQLMEILVKAEKVRIGMME